MLWSMMIGAVISFLLAANMSDISEWNDGSGQELLFVFVLSLLAMLITFANMLVVNRNNLAVNSVKYIILYSAIIVLAMSLEGAEIIIYFESRLSDSNHFKSSLLGGILGLGIGLSVGAASYYLLNQSKRFGLKVSLFLLSMVAAGMISQAVSYLMQAGMIDGGYPIWDSSAIVSEYSVIGQLFYALIGYEATPTLVQAVAYFAFLLVPPLSIFYIHLNRKKQES